MAVMRYQKGKYLQLRLRGSLRLQPPSPGSVSFNRQYLVYLQFLSISELEITRKEFNIKDKTLIGSTLNSSKETRCASRGCEKKADHEPILSVDEPGKLSKTRDLQSIMIRRLSYLRIFQLSLSPSHVF